MTKGKKVRTKGKIKFSDYFKNIDDGSRVAIVRELGISSNVPGRIVGSSGVVKGSRGQSKLVEINDGNKTKTFVVHPVHLKKLK